MNDLLCQSVQRCSFEGIGSAAVQVTLTFERGFPHRMLGEQLIELLDHHCGIMYQPISDNRNGCLSDLRITLSIQR